MNMTRTFHPVGQGGFFTEVFRDDSSLKKFTVAYDVGSKTANKEYLKDAIKLVGKVDVVFLSHLHEDHINGLPLLLKKNPNLKIIMPVLSIEEQLETALYNMINSNGSSLVYNEDTFATEYSVNKESIVTIDKSGDVAPETRTSIENITGKNLQTIIYYNAWSYIPYNPKATKGQTLIENIKESKELQSLFDNNDKINDEAIRKVFKKSSKKEILKETYNKICGSHNSYSMVVYSGLEKETKIDFAKVTGSISANCEVCHYYHHLLHHRYFWEVANCLYTGDAELANGKSCEILKSYYKDYWDFIRIVQVPHHGSKNNFNKDLCSPFPRLFVISVGSNNSYGHPSVSVINEIYKNDGCLSIITESSVPLSFKYEL